MFEVHDCFSVTELVTMEDLHISENGRGWKDVLDGFYDADGKIPCQIDGGLKCFGHPIGASGLRMAYEIYLQLQGRAGERQLRNPRLGLTHNLGGTPYNNVACISIIGRLDSSSAADESLQEPVMTAPFRYKKLGYVALNVTDVARTHDFVMNIIGLDEAGQGAAGERYYRVGSDHHAVILYPAKQAGFKRAGWHLESAGEV